MHTSSTYQIVIGGVGGQGVLFITRLLAEAAIAKGLAVFTSETHGMAQRGGTVISHLKVGDFTSPLINPGRADGLIALKPESLTQHGGYLKKEGWVTVNSPSPMGVEKSWHSFFLDADRLARELNNPKTLNLLMLGFSLSHPPGSDSAAGVLYCTVDDIAACLEERLRGKPRLLESCVMALRTGAEKTTG
jgi:indolepyruvate ferredoxin oxidoreductase beta subunit